MSDYFDDSLLDDVFVRDLSILKPEYQPEEIEERDTELNTYVNQLSPILKGWDTDNIFLYGESGVGKTLATRLLLPELREKAKNNGVDVDIVEVNCSESSSSYQAAIKVVNETYSGTSPLTTLELSEPELNNTGYPSSMVYDKLFEALQAGGDYLILVLDEIDGIGTDGELLYQLTRGQSMGKLDAEICIIGISNDLYFKDNLKMSVKDTLCESEIHFPTYNSNDLIGILCRRADQAFFPGALDDGVIELCAAISTRDHGSARQAIRLLRNAALIAEEKVHEGEEVPVITEEHVRQAKTAIESRTIETGIQKLNESQRYILLALTNIHAIGNTPAETSTIKSTYSKLVRKDSLEPLSRRGVHGNLLALCDNGIIKITNNARNQRGVPNRYSLRTEFETVIDALESAEGSSFQLDELRETARMNNIL